jgi:uncharacterized circularly permuted ATP-grasp superfamily protein|tara:strand:- start:213 stop:1655 length:1443 start_codon:yes stop_codon:yes gene_type:complete
MVGKLWNNYNASKAYDGYFTNENKLRKHAVIISSILEKYGKEKLQEIEKNCQSTISARGINFRVYAANNRAEEKKWPLDIIPRIIPKSQWNKVTRGLKQRVKALNLFIDDAYNQKKIFKDNIIPKEIIFNSPYYVKECEGFSPKYKSWANISGVDLIRNKNGDYLVLEDNLRVPSGVSYMLENRMVMRDVFPELFTRYKVSSIHQYTNKLFNCMNECIPKKNNNPHMVVLTPGIYNSAYFEHSFLAQQMGIALVEGKDLFVENDHVYMKTVKGPLRVDCIYRRLDDNFLDPKAFNKHSLIGVPGLFKCWLKKNVGIINAIGTGIADDKVVYSYVNKMIVYYLGEQPILNQVETYLCHDEKQREYVLENLSKLVVKPANASGGYGIMIGPKASDKERGEVAEKIRQNPREYIAQPLEVLSTAPTITDKNIEPRHLDLRPFILSGKTNYVTTGGLTRVALRKGSTIVNSSQGGGSKDTLIVD